MRRLSDRSGNEAACRLIHDAQWLASIRRPLYYALQPLPPLRISPPPSLQRQRQKLLLARRQSLTRPLFIEPSSIMLANRLDLPRQFVPDRSTAFDLAPHAGANLQSLREGLLEPLRRDARAHLRFGKLLEEREDVLAAIDGDVRHDALRVRHGLCEKDCRTLLTKK